MSGLFGFFKDYIPNVQNIDYSRPWEDMKSYEKKTRHSRTIDHTTNSNHHHDESGRHEDDDVDGDEAEEGPRRKKVHRPLIAARRSLPSQGREIEYMEGALSFGEWRKTNKKLMEVYWEERLISPDLDDGTGQTEDENDDDEDEEDWNGKQDTMGDEVEGGEKTGREETILPQLESQPPLAEPNITEQMTQRQRRRRRISPLYHAIHSVNTLAYLNLTTKDISIELCRVTKVWRLRTTKRGLRGSHNNSNLHAPERTKYCCAFPGRMPRIAFGHMQDDGPLGCCYDHVFSFEIEQLTPHIPSSLRRSVRVFFYNAYAKAMAEWMAEQTIIGKSDKGGSDTSKDYYILNLSNIPAKCILPYAIDPRDWWDEEHIVPYCLCIGDDSDMIVVHDSNSEEPEQQRQSPQQRRESMRSDDTTSQKIHVRMDSIDMEIRITKTRINQEENLGPELILSPNLFHQDNPEDGREEGDRDFQNDASLLKSWTNYCQRLRKQPPPSLPPTADEMPAPTDVPGDGLNPTSTNVLKSAPPLVIPDFAMAAIPPFATFTTVENNDYVTQQQTIEPVQVPPNRLPPPSPVHRPIEPMDFAEGPTRKRAHVDDDATTSLSSPSPISLRYEKISNLVNLYKESKSSPALKKPQVDLYGLVVGFTPPSQTKRGDWMCQCNLVDESCTLPVTLIIFSRDVEDLPKFQKMGDVLRMHRIVVGQWNGSLQLTALRESSFVVIRCNPNHHEEEARWKVEPTACKEYHFETLDEQRSQNLWNWGQKLIEEQPTMHQADHKCTLRCMSRLTEGDADQITGDLDLTVMVTAILPLRDVEVTSISACGLLRVWDGTGDATSDPLPLDVTHPAHSLFGQQDGDPNPTAIGKIASIIHAMKEKNTTTLHSQQQQQRDDHDNNDDDDSIIAGMEIPESTCGNVVNVIIWEKQHWNLIQNYVDIGTFLRLRNTSIRNYRGENSRCK